MKEKHKTPPARRRYHAPRRIESAARTRLEVVVAARDAFERVGWGGTTVAAVAESAHVSPKTIEALYGTKAALLRAAVDFAIRGDVEDVEMPRRPEIAEIERAASAGEMLNLHARLVRDVNVRSAAIARAVEEASAVDPQVEALWHRMNDDRRYAVRWAARTVSGKPGFNRELARRDVEATFWVGLGWETYRLLTEQMGLSARGFERWLRSHYRQLLHDE
jgi:AcrR family transcriptional regulator